MGSAKKTAGGPEDDQLCSDKSAREVPLVSPVVAEKGLRLDSNTIERRGEVRADGGAESSQEFSKRNQ